MSTLAARRGRAASTRPLQLESGILVLVTLGLVAFGLVMVYSASSARAAVGDGDPAYFIERQAVYAVVGFCAFLVLSRVELRGLRTAAGPFLAASLFLLVVVLLVGTSVNGAKRWLLVGPISVQPSELAKLALALWLAAFLARRSAPRTFGELVRPIGLVTGLASLLVLAEPDLGTAISFAVLTGAVLLVAGTPMRLMGISAGIIVGIVLVASWLEPYRRARLFSFLNPWDDAQGAGFQAVQAQIALGSGGLFGVGLGESVQKVYYLPEATTDMIFAIVGEELGLVGTAVLIVSFVLFGYAGFSIALRSSDPFGKCLAAGLTALVCGQAAVNLGAVLGFSPLTGVPLPFVSYGGSSLIVSLASAGILLTIARTSGRATARASVPDRRRRNGGTRPARARRGGGAQRAGRQRQLRRLA